MKKKSPVSQAELEELRRNIRDGEQKLRLMQQPSQRKLSLYLDEACLQRYERNLNEMRKRLSIFLSSLISAQ